MKDEMKIENIAYPACLPAEALAKEGPAYNKSQEESKP